MSDTPGSLDKIGSEMLIIIAEVLYAASRQHIPAFRLTCRKFNFIANPLFYREIKFNTRKLNEVQQMGGQLLGNVHHNLKHVMIETAMVWEELVAVLSCCVKLSDITWVFFQWSRDMRYFPVPLRHFCDLRPRLRLSIRHLEFPKRLPAHPNIYQPSTTIPASNITKISTAIDGPGSITAPIQDFLMSCARLEVLHLSYQPTPFVPMARRFPAISELSLRSPDWAYTSEEAAQIWDFSQLKRLNIKWWTLGSFLQSVSLESLKNLRTLLINYDGETEKWIPLEVAENYHNKRMELLNGLLGALPLNQLTVDVYDCGDEEGISLDYHPLLEARFNIRYKTEDMAMRENYRRRLRGVVRGGRKNIQINAEV